MPQTGSTLLMSMSWHWFRRLHDAFSYAPLHFVILRRRQHPYERHHPHHRSSPTRRQSVRVWLRHLFVHDHDHVLRVTGHTLLLLLVARRKRITVLLLHWSNYVRRVSVSLRVVAHPAAKLRSHVFRQRVTLTHD